MKTTLKIIPISIFAAWIFLTISCSYDNSLYNARRYFKLAQDRPLTQQGKPSPQAIDEYTKTIKKCGFILTEKPKSKEADDALYLLARSLYYKGNSQFQAKDQFLSLLENFPKSPFVPESVLYIARINRQINQKAEAENVLEAYIGNPKNQDNHSKAMLLLADFAVQDKDFAKSQYWLERILSKYPKSLQAKEALFLLGKNIFEQAEFEKSLKQFQKVLQSRVVSRNVKLDARYYIALNYLNLGEFQKSYTLVKKLLRDENRPEKISEVKLIMGRTLLAMDNETEALEFLQSVIKSNPRSLVSAESYYRLAEFYLYVRKDVSQALENYNKAKTESSTSPFQNDAADKHKALVQISNVASHNVVANPQQFVEALVESAENYIVVINMPDSAYAIFDKISSIPLDLQSQLDTLLINKTNVLAGLDSLSIVVDSILIVSETDSLGAQIFEDQETPTDSLMYTKPDLSIISDSLSLDQKHKTIPIADSTKTFNSETNVPVEQIDNTPILSEKEMNINKIDQMNAALTSLNQQINDIDSVKVLFQEEFIPFSLFAKAALIEKTSADSVILNQIYAQMALKYPQNKYTIALKLLLEGKTVNFIDPEHAREESELDYALTNIESQPDSILIILRDLATSKNSEIRNRALFRLGWYYTFEQTDTTAAKDFYNQILEEDLTTDVSRLILRYYNGTKFTINFSPDSDTDSQNTNSDSLSVDSFSDSILSITEPDSLKFKIYPLTSESDSMNAPKNEFDGFKWEIKETESDIIKPKEPELIKKD